MARLLSNWNELRLPGLLIVVGAGASFAGGAIGAALGAWSARQPEELLGLVADAVTAWRWTNYLFVFGVPIAAAGVAAVSARVTEAPLATVGVVLWLVGAALGVVAFSGQSEATIVAARIFADRGEVPDAYQVAAAWTGGAMAAFMVLSYAASVLIGVSMLSSSPDTRGLAWAAVLAPIVLSPLVLFGIPAGVLLNALVFAAIALTA